MCIQTLHELRIVDINARYGGWGLCKADNRVFADALLDKSPTGLQPCTFRIPLAGSNFDVERVFLGVVDAELGAQDLDDVTDGEALVDLADGK